MNDSVFLASQRLLESWKKMRFLCLSVLVAMGFTVMSLHATAAECPLDLSLTSGAEVFVAQLKNLPSVKSERKIERPPLFGHCTYEASMFMQMNTTPEGLCSIGGQPAMMSTAEILDSRATVVGHGYLVLKSDESLSAIKSALRKLGTAVSREGEPKAWTTVDNKHWIVDVVYAKGDDLWTVTHAQLEPGETRTSPEIYIVEHVRREWLDFSNRDQNTCTELPE